jgi:hypothetical protein
MKCKATTGKSFTKAKKYADKADAKFVDSSTTDDPKSFLKQCAKLRAMRPDCTVPVLHFSIGLPEGERLDQAGWTEASSKFLSKLGLNGNDYYAVQHFDKPKEDHIHLIVSKIKPDGSLWNTQNSALRAMRACTEIEVEMCLTITKTLAEFRQETKLRRQQITDNELRMVVRTGKPGDLRKKAIAAKIASQKLLKEKTDEKNRTAIKDGITNQQRDGQYRDAKKSGASLQANGKQNKKNGVGNPIAKSRRIGESVNFYNHQKELVLIASDDRIELIKNDDESIKSLINKAFEHNMIPLNFFGDEEFKKHATDIAEKMGIPVKSKELDKLQSEIKIEADFNREKAIKQAVEQEKLKMERTFLDSSEPAPLTLPRMRM